MHVFPSTLAKEARISAFSWWLSAPSLCYIACAALPTTALLHQLTSISFGNYCITELHVLLVDRYTRAAHVQSTLSFGSPCVFLRSHYTVAMYLHTAAPADCYNPNVGGSRYPLRKTRLLNAASVFQQTPQAFIISSIFWIYIALQMLRRGIYNVFLQVFYTC